jgi:hypothetical protein
MKTYTLTNSFHNTSARILDVPGLRDASEAWDRLQTAEHHGDATAKRKIARIRRALCGAQGCKCGVVR